MIVVTDSTPGRPAPSVDELILKEVQGSSLNDDHAKRMRLALAAPEELEALGRKPIKAMRIPYFDLDGGVIDFCRYRYLEDPRGIWEKMVTKQKAIRYFQPAETGVHAYFPPFMDWRKIAQDTAIPIYITEGEKKAASGTAHGFPTIGLGGVDCYQTRREETPLLPELMEFKWEGREVVIVFDSDAATNPNVLAASVRLGRRLFELRAIPKIANIPAKEDGGKQGLDDFIVNAKAETGHVKQALADLFLSANDELFEREIALYGFNGRFVYLMDMDKVIRRDDKVLMDPVSFATRAFASEIHREWQVKQDASGAVVKVAKVMQTAVEWLKWSGRQTALTLDFSPSAPEFTPEGYNLWQGFAVEPRPGSAALWTDLLATLFPLPDERKWFEQWCAYPLQHPGAKLKTACLIWAREEGTGKSTLLESLRGVYGKLYSPQNDKAIDRPYTDWLVNKLMVGVDDIESRNRDDHAGKWKNLITSDRLSIDKKYVSSFEINSHVNFILTSNDPAALRLSNQDRRYFIHHAAPWASYDERQAFFNKYYPWLHANPGVLLHHLLTVDLEGFDPNANAPVTAAKREMQDLSRSPVEQWLMDLVDAPDAILRVGVTTVAGDLWTADDLCSFYNAQPLVKTPVGRNTMGMALGVAGFAKAYRGMPVKLTNGKQARLFIVRNLDKWMNADRHALVAHYEGARKYA